MQRNSVLLVFLLSLLIGPTKSSAQVSISDSMALVDLYDSTNGNTWYDDAFRISWKSSLPVKSWAGVSVSNNRVVKLQMWGNHLTGIVPASFKNLDGITAIDFIDNGFRGDLLDYIPNFKELTSLHIGEAYLTGPFPSSLGYLPKLISFYVYGLSFDGPIPASFGNLSNLGLLDVSYSAHSGYIPAAELSDLNLGPHSLILTANRYTFKELEPLVEIFRAKNKEDALDYDQQQNIATIQQNDDLTVAAGGVLQHNTYQWYKLGTGLVATITGDSVYKATAPGTYYASVTNSVATQLTLNNDLLKTATVALNICPQSSAISISSDVSGATYQWQESGDSINFYK